MWEFGLDGAGSGQGKLAGTCEVGNEPSGSIKGGGFLDQMTNGYPLKKDSAPWSKYTIFEQQCYIGLHIIPIFKIFEGDHIFWH